ncbi:ASCH domain-containing protein [Gymnodinialimonas sp.]
MTEPLPALALSVRQPSAWAIIHGGKEVENRSLGSIRAGRMGPGRIAIHASIGMKREEYDYLVWRWQRDGVHTPRPDALPRRAIIGTVEVVDVITESDSLWFGGEAGLLLRNPEPCVPVPASGALGYFRWEASGALADPLPWMRDWGASDGGLFEDLPVAHKEDPTKPFGRKKI